MERRDDDVEEMNNDAQAVNEEEHNPEFDWEVVIDKATLKGESGSREKFYDAEDEVQESAEVSEEVPADPSTVQKEKTRAGVDPSIPSGSIPDFVVLKLHAELEQA
ncbi:hypothetical protein Dimus_013275 [Dionaea muscipula]